MGLWFGALAPNLIHIRAARLIHKGMPKGMTDEDILARVGWMPLEYFYKFRILIIILIRLFII